MGLAIVVSFTIRPFGPFRFRINF